MFTSQSGCGNGWQARPPRVRSAPVSARPIGFSGHIIGGGVRLREAILLMYIRRIPRRQAHASENENACISENALTYCNVRGSLHTPAHLTDSLCAAATADCTISCVNSRTGAAIGESSFAMGVAVSIRQDFSIYCCGQQSRSADRADRQQFSFCSPCGVWCPPFRVCVAQKHPKGWTPNRPGAPK